MLKTRRTADMVKGEKKEEAAFRVIPQSPEKFAKARAHRDRKNMVVTYGCHYCCGRIYRIPRDPETGEEFKLGCALLASSDLEQTLSPESRKKAEACKVPALYAEVSSRKAGKLTARKVFDLVPDIPELHRSLVHIHNVPDLDAEEEEEKPPAEEQRQGPAT